MSDFSLDFPAFGPSVLVKAREEVGLRCEGYTWTSILWSFDNSRKQGFSPTCFIPWLRAILMGRDILRHE